VEGTTPTPNKEESMTRKDYVLIAETIKEAHRLTSEKAGAGVVAYMLANTLQADNPRFDRARFLDACGVM